MHALATTALGHRTGLPHPGSLCLHSAVNELAHTACRAQHTEALPQSRSTSGHAPLWREIRQVSRSSGAGQRPMLRLHVAGEHWCQKLAGPLTRAAHPGNVDIWTQCRVTCPYNSRSASLLQVQGPTMHQLSCRQRCLHVIVGRCGVGRRKGYRCGWQHAHVNGCELMLQAVPCTCTR